VSDYREFLARKAALTLPAGMERVPALLPALKDHQRIGVEAALRRGRAALFYDTGLGKTLMQLEWARCVHEHTGGPVLIMAPLAVAGQTVKEGQRFGIDVTRLRGLGDVVGPGVNIINYDRLEHVTPEQFAGVVLDESSILKNFAGATKNALVSAFAGTPYRLCCTATPAPNDYMEIGNHSEFLGLLPMNEMLQRWFINDTSEASQSWRLKGHAVASFWDWVASWGMCVSLPSDIGCDDDGYDLPELRTRRHIVASDVEQDAGEMLFRMPVMSATEMHGEKRRSVVTRAAKVASLVGAEPREPWLIWCDTDYEADALKAALPDAVEVRGSMTIADKERRLDAFSDGRTRVLITKPTVAGFGMNWQHCARIAFAGVSYSYEKYYQAIRRCWRFGQTRPVEVHVVMGETEATVWATVSRKADAHDGMKLDMIAATRRAVANDVARLRPYNPTFQGRLPSWLHA
jgi:hypothetical protein